MNPRPPPYHGGALPLSYPGESAEVSGRGRVLSGHERMFVRMTRQRISPRRQGDLGELSAIEWLTWTGATVFTPIGHSPDVDLIADLGGRTLRVEVKTGTHRSANGNWNVMIATMGGNQSWSGVVKRFDPGRCEYLFVHVGDGRRWFIPTDTLACDRQITLGGSKHSEFEIEPGRPLTDAAPLQSRVPLGECQSGQMECAVNASAMPTEVRILPPPLNDSAASNFAPVRYERADARVGQTRIGARRAITLPVKVAAGSGLRPGDRLRARAVGPGQVTLERIEQPPLTTRAATAPAAAA